MQKDIEYKHLPNYLLVLVSIAYSSYVVFHFLNEQFGEFVAVPSAVACSFFAHYYLVLWVKSIKQGQGLHGSMFLAIVLFGMVFSFEWLGTSVMAEKALVKTERLNALQSQSEAITNKILSLESYKNWRDISARQDYVKEQKSIKEKIEEEKTKIAGQQEKAEQKATHFKFISAILALVSAVATLLSLEDETSLSSLAVKSYSLNPQENQTKSQVLQQDLSVYNQVNVDKSLIDLPANERINQASQYIQRTGELDQRKIMPLFRLNPIQVGKAKKLAGVKSSKSTNQQTIGFN